MMKRIYRLSILPMLAILAVSCSAPRTRSVVILSTNDIHAAIQNFPRLATAIAECRDTAEVILVDAGDRWTGNAYVDHAAEKCRPVIDLMNRLGYDAATVGNHEFDHGQELLAERIAQADFDVICANMKSSSQMLNLAPTKIVERGGIKVGIVGLVTNFANGHPDGNEVNFSGLEFPSPFETAAEYQSLGKKCDLLVALTHIGDDMDRVLTVSAPEYDLIVGGHTHTVIPEGQLYGNTLITQTGKNLTYIGVTEVEMKGDSITRLSNRLVPLAGYAEDPDMKAAVEVYYNDPELRHTVGSTDTLLNKVGLANFMASAIASATESEIGIYHFGGVRLDSLPSREVCVGDIYTVEPFSSTVCTVEMTVAQIRDLIINKFNDTKNPKESHRPDLNPWGMSYTIVTDAKGDAVDVIFKGIEKEKTYKVAMCNYIFNNYNFDRSGRSEQTGRLVTDIMCAELGSSSPLRYDNRLAIDIKTADECGIMSRKDL